MVKVIPFPSIPMQLARVAGNELDQAKQDLMRAVRDWDATDPHSVRRHREAQARYDAALERWSRHAITL